MTSYDLDTSGGLMDEIQALIAPPVLEGEEKKKKQDKKRRPRKGNHDFCDSCKGVGDLICCDQCPASFHLLCQDPPLEDIPPGKWFCNRCISSITVKTEPDDTYNDGGSAVPTKKSSARSAKSDSEADSGIAKPLKALILAAKTSNPCQYILNEELQVPFIFPGGPKVIKREGTKKRATRVRFK